MPSIFFNPINSKKDNTIIDCGKEEPKLIVTDLTEEKFLNSFAERKGISYDEAKKINDNLINEDKRKSDYEIKYKIVEQKFSINSDITLIMATEVEYLYSNVNDEVLSIVNVGNSFMEVEGVSLYKWSCGDLNIESNSKSTRISQTGQAYLKIQHSYCGGIDTDGLTFAYTLGTSRIYYTPVKTYVMKITLRDLK